MKARILQIVKEEEMTNRFGFPINAERVFDRHFATQTRGTRKTSLVDDYEDEGWRIELSYEASNEVDYGHKRVKRLLKYLPDGDPGIVIWKNCYHTWNGLRNYIRKKRRTKSDMDKPLGAGKIIEKYKDFPDVIRMMACHETVSYEESDLNYQYNKRQSALDFV